MREAVSVGALAVRQSRRVPVSCVHPAAIPRAVSCTICSLSMFSSEASGDHMAEAYPSTGLAMALHHRSLQPLCHDLSDSGCMEVIINHP